MLIKTNPDLPLIAEDYEEKGPKRIPTEIDTIPLYSLKDAGDHSDEEAYNDDAWFIEARIIVKCPHCEYRGKPLLSRFTLCRSNGWRWVGTEWKEPYGIFSTRCNKCRKPYRFTLHTPQ